MKEQILRNLIRESIKKMISESTLKEYSGDSGLEELADTLGYSDVIEFFEDNSGAVEAVYKWVESIPALKQKMQQSGMFESSLKEDVPGEKYVVYTYREGNEDKKEIFQKNNTLAYAKQLVNRNNRDSEESDIWGYMKQSEWESSLKEANSANVMETKIKEAGGRRFIKSENIRQHNMSKIKEANKKK